MIAIETSASGGDGALPVASGDPPVAPEPGQNVSGTGTGGVQLRPAETGVPPLPTTRQSGVPRMAQRRSEFGRPWSPLGAPDSLGPHPLRLFFISLQAMFNGSGYVDTRYLGAPR